MTSGSLRHLAVLAFFWLALPAAAGAADWPMWAGSPQRNMVNTREKQIPESWDVKTGKNVKWIAQLGSQSYGCPTVADGKVFVGTNNSAQRLPKAKGDKGIELCFRESDGKFLWQMTHDKLAAGRVNDWPRQGICSSACVEGKRVYYVSNRCELVSADTEGLQDGKVIWKLDMIRELGVHPHNMSASSPVIWGDLVFVITGNGVDESHIVIPAPEAPDFLAVNKHTGEVVWDRNNPGEHILHGQWSSPAVGLIAGQEQVDLRRRRRPALRLHAQDRRSALVVPGKSPGLRLQARRPGHPQRDHCHPGHLATTRSTSPWARTPSTAKVPDTSMPSTPRSEATSPRPGPSGTIPKSTAR